MTAWKWKTFKWNDRVAGSCSLLEFKWEVLSELENMEYAFFIC